MTVHEAQHNSCQYLQHDLHSFFPMYRSLILHKFCPYMYIISAHKSDVCLIENYENYERGTRRRGDNYRGRQTVC